MFESYGTAASETEVGYLGQIEYEKLSCPMLLAVLGSRGSADTVYDTRVSRSSSTRMKSRASRAHTGLSYRTMEGFGVHTFRLVDAAGKSSLGKFRWKAAARPRRIETGLLQDTSANRAN